MSGVNSNAKHLSVYMVRLKAATAALEQAVKSCDEPLIREAARAVQRAQVNVTDSMALILGKDQIDEESL